MIRNNSGTTPLGFKELADVMALVKSLTRSEVHRFLNEVHQTAVLDFLNDFYYRYRLYSLFVPSVLSELSEAIFANEILRDYVLNLTERTGFFLSTSDIDVNQLTELVVKAVTQFKRPPAENNYSLMNKKVREALFITADPVRTVLHDNFWLLVLIIVYLNGPLDSETVAET